MTCWTCYHGAVDPDSDCPDCQIAWAEMVEAMCVVGAKVRVQLPEDVAPWWDEAALGAAWDAEVVCINGDSLDVSTPTGDVEPVPVEYCLALR